MNYKRFYSRTDNFYRVVVALLCILFSSINGYIFATIGMNTNNWIFFVLSIFIVVFLVILPQITYLKLTERELICKTFCFIRKNIPIASITKIERSKHLFAGLKFTTALNGLIVHYNRYDEILIGPAEEVEFLLEITKRNSNIELKLK